MTLFHSLLPITWSSFSAGAMKVLLQDCTGARMLPNSTANFFDYKTTGTLPDCTAAASNLGLLPIFLTTRLHGGNHPDDGSIFPCRKPILFGNIIMHLLHSCIHCDLDHLLYTLQVTWSSFSVGMAILFDNIIMHLLHSCIHCELDLSCSILHKSRDLLFAYGWRWRHHYQTARRHITKSHGCNHPEDGSKNIWSKADPF